MKQNIVIVFFSATWVTASYTDHIRKKLVDHVESVALFDVTSYASRKKPINLNSYKNVIFGFPVYADFAPSVINDWLPTLDGKGKRCTIFLTYGGRTTGYAHFHTKLLLELAGFKVLLTAEFLGRHSFNQAGWSILPDRPNQADLAVASEYALLALDLFTQDNPPTLKLQKPFGYSRAVANLTSEKDWEDFSWPQPHRTTEICSMCFLCEEECPTQAFGAVNGLPDCNACILCMHCVWVCPEQVIGAFQREKVSNQEFLDYCHLDEVMLAEKKSKIIKEHWQAAA